MRGCWGLERGAIDREFLMNYIRRRLSGSGRAGEARVARWAHDGCIRISHGSREIPEAANATFHTDKKTEPVE